jgi:hypothetical protein
MADGKAIDRATARGGIDGGLTRLRHAQFIRGNGAGLKRKVRLPANFQNASALHLLFRPNAGALEFFFAGNHNEVRRIIQDL